jgi:hypothetical protein
LIQETLSRNSNPALTSDRWHVLHARWSNESSRAPLFVRSIVSEHDDHAAAVRAAEAFLTKIMPGMSDRQPATRDQVLVRPPAYKSLKTGKRRLPRR